MAPLPKKILFMGYTKRGELLHLTNNGTQSLCDKYELASLVTNMRTKMPVPFREHWKFENGGGRHMCRFCIEQLDKAEKPYRDEKHQVRLI